MKKLILSSLVLTLGMAVALAAGSDPDSAAPAKAKLAPAADTNSASPVHITAKEAKAHLGQDAVVSGKVAEVNQTDRILRMNLDQPYPKQTFTVIIFASNTNQFEKLDLFSLEGKKVEISGTIKDYNGRPEISLTKTNQLKVLEEPEKQ